MLIKLDKTTGLTENTGYRQFLSTFAKFVKKLIIGPVTDELEAL